MGDLTFFRRENSCRFEIQGKIQKNIFEKLFHRKEKYKKGISIISITKISNIA